MVFLYYAFGGLVLLWGLYILYWVIIWPPEPLVEPPIPPAQISHDGKSPLRVRHKPRRHAGMTIMGLFSGLIVSAIGAFIVLMAWALSAGSW